MNMGGMGGGHRGNRGGFGGGRGAPYNGGGPNRVEGWAPRDDGGFKRFRQEEPYGQRRNNFPPDRKPKTSRGGNKIRKTKQTASKESNRIAALASLQEGFVPDFILFDPPVDGPITVKHGLLCPTAEHASGLSTLVTLVIGVLREEQEWIFETHLVGAFAKSLLLKGDTTGDIVVITKTAPDPAPGQNLEAIQKSLEAKLKERGGEGYPVTLTNTIITVTHGEYAVYVRSTWFGAWKALAMLKDPSGTSSVEVDNSAIAEQTLQNEENPAVKSEEEANSEERSDPIKEEPAKLETSAVMLTTESSELHKLNQIQLEECEHALILIRQVMWYKDRDFSDVSKSVIQIIKAFKAKQNPWSLIGDWNIEVLVDKSIPTSVVVAFGISFALRKFFELMAGGVALPGANGVPDPCLNRLDMPALPDDDSRKKEWDSKEILATLSSEQRLNITAHSQQILLELADGDWSTVLP